MVTTEDKARMVVANRKLARKLVLCWLAFFVVYFVCRVFEEGLLVLAARIADYVPVVEQQLLRKSSMGKSAASYFSALVLLVPPAAIYVSWKENFLWRIKVNAERMRRVEGRGTFEVFFWGYVLGVPFALFVIFLMTAAPFDMPENPRLGGQHVIAVMLKSDLGLLVIGSIAALGATVAMVILISAICIPASAILKLFKGEKNE